MCLELVTYTNYPWDLGQCPWLSLVHLSHSAQYFFSFYERSVWQLTQVFPCHVYCVQQLSACIPLNFLPSMFFTLLLLHTKAQDRVPRLRCQM